jgi:hypothetical protein
MFEDKPENQRIHYANSQVSNNVGLDPLWFVVVSKLFQMMKTRNCGMQQAQQEIHYIAYDHGWLYCSSFK